MRAKSSTQRSLHSESNKKMSLDILTQVQVHDHIKIKIILSYFREEISVLSLCDQQSSLSLPLTLLFFYKGNAPIPS
jgi:hypothetical protein